MTPQTTDDTDDDEILYLLSGTDAASFDINDGTGQISVSSSAKLDHETKPELHGDGHGQGPGGPQLLR